MRPISVELIPSVSGFWSTPTTELEIVIWRPSRIQAAPSPATMRVWNGDQPSRSSRAGIVLRIATGAAVLMSYSLSGRGTRGLGLAEHLGRDDPRRRIQQREVGEGLREVPEVP